MENMEFPSEYVSIRQIWLKRIDDCGKAIGQRAIQEPTVIKSVVLSNITATAKSPINSLFSILF